MSAAEEFDYALDLDEDDPIDENAPLDMVIEHHLSRLARSHAELAKVDAMFDKYKVWRDRQAKRHEEAIAWRKQMVESLMLERLKADPRTKSLNLPSGTVSTRKGSTVVEVEDKQALVDWSYDSGVGVRWVAEPDKEAIKQALAQGEIVPGCRLVEKDRTVSIKVETGE